MKDIEEKVISMLKNSRQTLGWIDAAVTPICRLGLTVDEKIEIMESLKKKGIVKYYTGFHSLAAGKMYVTSFTLTEKWFRENCHRARKYEQLKLF